MTEIAPIAISREMSNCHSVVGSCGSRDKENPQNRVLGVWREIVA